MDIYASPEPVMLDERALSDTSVSRTPIREASRCWSRTASSRPCRAAHRRVRKTKAEVVDMIRAWAALESMAARPSPPTARKKDISALRNSSRTSARTA